MKRKQLVVGGVIGVIVVGLIAVGVTALFNRAVDDVVDVAAGTEFRLEEGDYGRNGLVELTAEEYEEKVRQAESFIVIVRMEICPAEFPVTDTVKRLSSMENIRFYSLKDAEFRKTSLAERVRYLPSVAILREGAVVDYLDAEADEDIKAYEDERELLEWMKRAGVELITH